MDSRGKIEIEKEVSHTPYISFVEMPNVFYWLFQYVISQKRWYVIGSVVQDVSVIIRAQLLHALSLHHTLTAHWKSMNRRKDVVKRSLPIIHSPGHGLSPQVFPCPFRSYPSLAIVWIVGWMNWSEIHHYTISSEFCHCHSGNGYIREPHGNA